MDSMKLREPMTAPSRSAIQQHSLAGLKCSRKCWAMPATIASKAARFDSTVACGPTSFMNTFRPGASAIAPSCMYPGRGAAAPIPM